MWANDTGAAARIIALLPTTRTVELEGVAEGNASSGARTLSRWLLAVTAVVLLLAWAAAARFARAPPPQPQAPRVPASPYRAPARGDGLRRAVAAASDAEVLLA